MLHDFLNLPTVLLCVISVLIGAGLSILALIIIRKKFHWELFKQNHEVGGFLFNALGLIYAVLVAFVVFATWSDYKDASTNVDLEANQLHDLFMDSYGLPEQYQQEIKNTIAAYLRSIINDEWNLLSIGKPNPASKEILIALWKIYSKIENLNLKREEIIYSESLKKLNNLTDYRRLRILSSQQHIPEIIWIVIIIGALTSIGFSLFFGTKSLMLQCIMTGLFAATNSLVLLLILVLDHPFTGDIKISSLPFQLVLELLQQ